MPKAAFKLDAAGKTNDLHMINPHVGFLSCKKYKIYYPFRKFQEANILRRLRRSDNFVFSSSSSSSSSSTSGDDGKTYFTQQSTHHTNGNPSFANRFGGDDGGFAGAGFGSGAAAGGFAGGLGNNFASTGGFVFDDYNNGGGSNYAGTSGQHYGASSSGSHGSGTHYSGSGSGAYHGNRKPSGQTVITSGVIDHGKVHSKTEKINHYD